MGQSNRARRAAKQRDRQARAARAAEAAGLQPSDPPSDEELAQLAAMAATAVTRDLPVADQHVATLGQYDEQDQARVDRSLSGLLARHLRAAWERGWLPADLAHYGGRFLDATGERLLIAAIASEHQSYSEPTLDPRWSDQLAELGLTERPFAELRLTDWAADARLGRYLTLHTALAVAGLVESLPTLPRLLPLPGTPVSSRLGPAAASARGSADNHKMLGRIRALLAKAEGTDFPDEAEALSAKAQELMAKFSLDRALVEADPDRGPADGSAARRIWVDTPYVSAKAHLVDAVASANRCRTVSMDQLAVVTVIGAELDLQLTELLSTSLLVQANRAMLAAGHQSRAEAYEGESRSRSFRQSFLMAYAQRIGERLQATAEATQAAVPEADADRLLPVLGRREEQVDALFTKLFPQTVMRRTRVSNGAGWAAGRTAADLARLDARRSVRPA